MIYLLFIVSYLSNMMNISSELDNIWVLREFQGTRVYIQFIDFDKKKAYAKEYEVDVIVHEDFIEIGNYSYYYKKEGDLLILENEPMKYIFKKYSKPELLIDATLIQDNYWLFRDMGTVFNFKNEKVSTRLEEKQLEIIENDGTLGGDWSLFEHEGITLLRSKPSSTKSQFITIESVTKDYFDAFIWDVERKEDVPVRFDRVKI